MQSTSALLRVAARLLILALTAFVLVALGCTGAQAFPETPPSATSSPSALHHAVIPVALHAAVSLDKPEQHHTTCIPGRNKVRVEQNAIVTTTALLQHSPGANGAALPHLLSPELGTEQPSGRIPDALTHLDLGIVRT